MLDAKHLRLILATYEAGTLTRAAEQLNATQSALSHQLRHLEARLGVTLFDRIGKTMRITNEGRLLLAAAQSVLSELERVEDAVRQARLGRTGPLRVSTLCYTSYHWMPALIGRFRARHPNVELDIVVDAIHRLADALLSREIDIGVTNAPVVDDRLLSRPLFEDEIVAVVSPDHHLADRERLKPEDLNDQSLLVHRKRDNYILSQVLLPAGVRPARISELPITEGLRELAKAGLGVALMSRWAAESSIVSGELRALRITPKGVWRLWSAVFLKDHEHPDYHWDFVDMLTEIPFGEGARPASGIVPMRAAE